MSQILPARTVDEIHAYLALQGIRETGHALVTVGADLAARYDGVDAAGQPRSYFFTPVDGRPPAGPSRIIDAGQWLQLSDARASNPAGTRADLEAAIRYMEEVLWFFPEGPSPAVQPFFTPAGAAYRDAQPQGTFSRPRLLARLDAYRRMLQPATPPAAAGGAFASVPTGLGGGGAFAGVPVAPAAGGAFGNVPAGLGGGAFANVPRAHGARGVGGAGGAALADVPPAATGLFLAAAVLRLALALSVVVPALGMLLATLQGAAWYLWALALAAAMFIGSRLGPAAVVAGVAALAAALGRLVMPSGVGVAGATAPAALTSVAVVCAALAAMRALRTGGATGAFVGVVVGTLAGWLPLVVEVPFGWAGGVLGAASLTALASMLHAARAAQAR